MATAAPSARDIETLRKDLAGETKRVDGIVTRLNEILQGAKDNDDRIEKMVKELQAKSGGDQGKRVDRIVAKLNEVLVTAKKNDDRIEAMVKALEAKVEALGKR